MLSNGTKTNSSSSSATFICRTNNTSLKGKHSSELKLAHITATTTWTDTFLHHCIWFMHRNNEATLPPWGQTENYSTILYILMKESLEKRRELPPTSWINSRVTHSFPVGVVHRWNDSSDHNEASRFVQIFSGFFCKQRNKHKKENKREVGLLTKQLPNLWQSYTELSLNTAMEKHSS